MYTVESMDEARQLFERATILSNSKIQSKLLTRLKHVLREAGIFIMISPCEEQNGRREREMKAMGQMNGSQNNCFEAVTSKTKLHYGRYFLSMSG